MKKYYEARIDFDFASVYSLVKYRELEKPKSELFFVNFGKKSKKKVFTLARRWETFSGKNWKNKYFKCSDFEHYEHTRESFQSPEGIIRCSTQGSEFLSFSCLVATTVVSATAPIATATTTAVTITTAPTAVVSTVTFTVIIAVSVLK